MSGLFGVYHRDDRHVEIDILIKMGASMAHRGPDGTDTWHNGSVGLGHCMLHTTPESLGETLPYIDKEADLVITADARIDNRNELASQLSMIGRLKDNVPDSQLILAAYRKWNRECVNYLLGDFTFVIWDQVKKQLFCARDHLGIKPFYYHLTGKMFVFASEVRAILKVPQVPHNINEGRIADFLVSQLEGIDKTSTFYNEVSRLPPAHTMLISKDKISIEQYWELDPEYETRYKSDEEYAEAFREIYDEAIRVRLRCNSHSASMLSGGIDSSSIVAVANKILNDSNAGPLHVYSGISDNEAECVETHFIRSVLSNSNLKPFTICPADLSKHEKELQSVFGMLEEPFDTHMTMIMIIYLMAQKNGDRVVLDGVEGDLVYSLPISYPAFLWRSGQWARALSEINGIWQNYYHKKQPFMKILLNTIRPALGINPLYQFRKRFLGKFLLNKALEGSIINRNFAHKIDIQSRLDQLRGHTCNGLCSTPRKQHIRNVMHPYLTVALERYDRVAAVCSVEPRHPLLDKRLVEFSISLPWDQKVRGGWSKFILRNSCESLLPEEVIWRKGWEHIGWSFTSTWMNARYDGIVKEIKEQESLLMTFLQNNFIDDINSSGYSVGEDSEKSDIWNVLQLARWIKNQRLT